MYDSISNQKCKTMVYTMLKTLRCRFRKNDHTGRGMVSPNGFADKILLKQT